MFDSILKTAETIGSTLAMILFSVYFCKIYIDKLEKKMPIGESVKKQNEEDKHIFETMEYYKELLGADRIMLFEFHNGQHYSNYRSALKLSSSYECYRAGLASQRDICSNLPISIMPNFISAITTRDLVEYKDIEDMRLEMPNAYAFKKNLGIKAFYDVPLKDKDKNIIGFVAVQWTHELPENAENYRATVDAHVRRLAWSLEESIKRITEGEKANSKNIVKKLFNKKK